MHNIYIGNNYKKIKVLTKQRKEFFIIFAFSKFLNIFTSFATFVLNINFYKVNNVY